MAVLLITHDLGVVAEAADDVAVMYAGELVEQAPAMEFFARPLHPYSQGLMACAPLLGNHSAHRLPSIPGMVPLPSELPEGCAFGPRCPHFEERCRKPQELREATPGHSVRCWKA
jgi:peptide/nickel transport system ATP-binding protein